MKIGIDLDGVIFDSEKNFRVYAELFDVQVLKRNSIINNQELLFQNRYRWTEEEIQEYFNRYQEKIALESNLMPGAKEVIELLKQEGHQLVIITARGGMNKNMIDIAKKTLKENKMDIFDNYYFAVKDKADFCEKENIDIMIDDSYEHCKKISERKIQAIYLKDAPSYDLENEYTKVLYNWGEIYRYIKEITK